MPAEIPIPAEFAEKLPEMLRNAKMGEIKEIAKLTGVHEEKLRTMRQRMGLAFSKEERASYMQGRFIPPATRQPRRVEGVKQDIRWFTDEDQKKIRKLSFQAFVVEPQHRGGLIRRARAGDIQALVDLHEQYFHCRLPLVEDRLSPEDRQQLPWLTGKGL
jgi:hypothetical protein